MDNYLLQYENHKNRSIKEFLAAIENLDGKDLNSLKVKDITYHNGERIYPGEGVYIFREGTKFVYVGKVSSMSFTERIPKHFDIRKISWFNRLLKILCEKKLDLPITDANLAIASNYAFEHLNLVLINFTDHQRIERTERLLRSCTSTLNKFKRLRLPASERALMLSDY